MLESDLAGLDEEYSQYYESKFISLFTAWMHRKSNCISSMITGPAKFPTRRAQRANNAEENAWKVFDQWRTKYLKRGGAPRVKITLDAELEKAINDLAQRERQHATMKAINAICRKPNAAELLKEQGWSDNAIHEFLNPAYSFYGKGYPKFELTNNNASINRLRERVDYLTSKVEKRESGQKDEVAFPGGTCLTNRVEDRVQFIFDEKPERSVIEMLKKSGWKWSPSQSAWQRKITPNAFASARQFIAHFQNSQTNVQA
jgi:predicted transcriptional regulator